MQTNKILATKIHSENVLLSKTMQFRTLRPCSLIHCG